MKAAHKRARKCLDRVREIIRLRHYVPSTEKTCVFWIRRYILYQHKRHPRRYQVLSELRAQMSNDELFRLVAEIVRDPSDPLFDTAIHELAWSRRPKAKPLVL